MRLVLKDYAQKKERFDKILFRSNNLEPVFVKIIGKDPVDNEYKIWPSDHWGIVCEFKVF